MINPEEFINHFGSQNEKDRILFGKVDPNYSSGRPSVIYDTDIIDGSLSKHLMRLASYTPAANDRVLIVNGVILGKIV